MRWELLAALERLISMGYLRAGTLAALVFVVTLAYPTDVTACSIALPPDPEQILRHQVESASLVFVGQVVAEKDFIFLHPGERRHGRATVQPVAILKGRAPGGPIDLQLGPGADCRGNPNLNLDERVLLFLKRGSLGGVGIQDSDKWYSPFNGYAKYLFKDGLAYREALPHIDHTTGLVAVGGAGDLLRKVASLAGPRLPWEEDQTARAIRFVEGNEDQLSMGTALSAQPPPANTPNSPAPPSFTPIPPFLMVGIVGGPLLGVAVLLWLRRRPS